MDDINTLRRFIILFGEIEREYVGISAGWRIIRGHT